MSIEKERKAFEDWYKKNIGRSLVYKVCDQTYLNSKTQESWLTWQSSANRDGYKLVPAEPTQKMLDAADGCVIDGKVTSNNIYKAMIGACDAKQEKAK